MGCAPEVWNPFPYLRILLPQKWLIWLFFVCHFVFFFFNFSQIGTHFLGFYYLKNGWFKKFFTIFVKWDPLRRFFLTKMGPMSKDFWWKSNPFERHIPVCLNMWVPPRLTLSTRMLSTDDRSKFSNIFKYIQIFIAIICIQSEKCTHISTNKPSIGSVVLEIAPVDFEKLMSNFNFCTLRSVSTKELDPD